MRPFSVRGSHLHAVICCTYLLVDKAALVPQQWLGSIALSTVDETEELKNHCFVLVHISPPFEAAGGAGSPVTLFSYGKSGYVI